MDPLSPSPMPLSHSSAASPPVTPCRRRFIPSKHIDTATLDTSIFSPMYNHSTPDMSYARRPPIAPSIHQPAGTTSTNSSGLASSTMDASAYAGISSPALICITPAAQLAPSYYSSSSNFHLTHGTPTTSDVTNGRTPSPFAVRFQDYDSHDIHEGIAYSGYENNTPLLSISELAPPSPPLDDMLLSDSFVSKCNIDTGVDKENRNPQNPTQYSWSPLRIAADLRDGTHEAIAVVARARPSASLSSLPSNNALRTTRAPLADITNQFVDIDSADAPSDFLSLDDIENDGEENDFNLLPTNHSSGFNLYTDVERKLEIAHPTRNSKKKRAIMPLKTSLRMMR